MMTGVKKLSLEFHAPPGLDGGEGSKVTSEAKAPVRGNMDKVPAPSPVELTPLEEALFPHWATANGIEDPHDPEHGIDLRHVYKSTNGLVHPPGMLQGASDRMSRLNQGGAGMADMLSQHAEQNPPVDPIRELLNHLQTRQ